MFYPAETSNRRCRPYCKPDANPFSPRKNVKIALYNQAVLNEIIFNQPVKAILLPMNSHLCVGLKTENYTDVATTQSSSCSSSSSVLL
jgi:hypothetical protein